MVTIISEEPAAYIFRVELKIESAATFETLTIIYQTTRRDNNPEDCSINNDIGW
jgi:hypothetical protein